MRVIRDFDTDIEKDTIITDMVSKGFTLVEEQYHFDGKHLVFENEEPEPELWSLVTEVETLKTKVEELEKR